MFCSSARQLRDGSRTLQLYEGLSCSCWSGTQLPHEKTPNLHFKSESNLHSTEHSNWLLASGPSYTYLQIE